MYKDVTPEMFRGLLMYNIYTLVKLMSFLQDCKFKETKNPKVWKIVFEEKKPEKKKKKKNIKKIKKLKLLENFEVNGN